MFGKILSLFIIGVYLTIGFFMSTHAGFQIMAFSVVPFFLIWFPDAMGSATVTRYFRPSITSKTHGCLVYAMGWVLLLFPVILYLVITLSEQ